MPSINATELPTAKAANLTYYQQGVPSDFSQRGHTRFDMNNAGNGLKRLDSVGKQGASESSSLLHSLTIGQSSSILT